VEDLDWTHPIDRNRDWAPGRIVTLGFLPSHAKLNPEERRRCNQLYALGICEQIIWLEQNFLVKTLARVLRRADVPPLLRTALEHFIIEEDKHTDMFWRMLERAEPERYRERKFNMYRMPAHLQLAIDALLLKPDTFLAWIWAAIFFEERTVDYCRHYLKSYKEDPNSVDRNFVQVQEFHFKDELRHYQLDQHLLTWLYDPQPAWKKRLCGHMFRFLMRGYVYPRNTAGRVLEELGKEFPRLRAEIIPSLRRELPGLGRNAEFHRISFSRASVPKTLGLFAEYAELDGIWDLFLAADKEGCRQGSDGKDGAGGEPLEGTDK
jgi:hypothetical protein